MFDIRLRIIEDLTILNEVSAIQEFEAYGYIEMDFNGVKYGYYANEPISEYEIGNISILNSFKWLLTAIKHLSTNDYIAINDVESYNQWLEFKRQGENLVVSLIQADKEDGVGEVTYKQLDALAYLYVSNQTILFNEFKSVIVSNANDIVRELRKLNNRIVMNKYYEEVVNLLEQI